MFDDRRNFLRKGLFGLATLGLSSGVLRLRSDADPTEPSGDLGDYGGYLKEKSGPAGKAVGDFSPTEANIKGPFYRSGAPFRAKITPPLSEGTVLLVQGRVWGQDTRQPLPHATLDIWQANHHGRYDNDDPTHPPEKGVFNYRARLVTDESGAYEYESVHPGRYKIDTDLWRPSHVHYMVQAPGYQTLITQLYFKGDPMNDKDAFIRPSLIVDVAQVRVGDASYEKGVFDIVLAKA